MILLKMHIWEVLAKNMSNNKPKGINQTDRKMSKKFEWELMEEFIQTEKC